ncbi:hypothetical protein ABIE59_001095 [Marinobacter sp. MBR-99]|jgi:hypothetical protein|uniref:ZrgA family zinc uptake protein n=1 Tax=Marinobacter sp. MBR-99 TaxID=3156461 RepID=UPI00339552D6
MFYPRASARSTTLLLSLSLAVWPVLASDNPGAHQHGHADLQMAIDNERVDLLLLSPAYNLIGFEHKPRTDEQRQRLNDTEQWASGTAMINTMAGNCTLVSSAMHVGWNETKDDDHKHDHGHSHNHSHDHDHNSGHADIEITQTLACPNLSASTQFETGLMARFPELENLNVQWVGPQGQGATRLSPGNIQFRLNR